MSFEPPEVDQISAAVMEKLRRGGLLPAGGGGQTPGWGNNALASAIAARLAQGLTPRAPGGRMVSEGMMRLASAVSYKLAKAEDPKTVTFNRVASDVAKALYQAKQAVVSGDLGGRDAVDVHSSFGSDGSRGAD